MYVTGLGKNNKPAWQFAAENGKRKRLCNFSHSRVSHTSAKYKGAIYVLGGLALSQYLLNVFELLSLPRRQISKYTAQSEILTISPFFNK